MTVYYPGSYGNDVIYGDYYADYLDGQSGNDWLDARAGSDTLVGGSGNDVLIGYGGTFGEYDVLYGDTGYDYGNLGYDTFVLGDAYWGAYYQGYGHATIVDWNPYYDQIQLSGYASQYSLDYDYISGTSALDTTIYYGNDLIGVIEDTTAVFPSNLHFV